MKKYFLFILLLIGVQLIVSAKDVILLAGDSTMASYPESQLPLCGWGQILPEFCKPGVQVKNFAVSGRSSKSFRADGYWDKLLAALTAGDIVIIQFGHNDVVKQKNPSDPDRYADPEVDFPANLTRFIKEVRAKKGQVILCTPVAYRIFEADGSIKNLHGKYPDAVRKVAKENNVPLIDLTSETEKLYAEYGSEKSKTLFKHCKKGEFPAFPEGSNDDCHSNENGARAIASIVAKNIKEKNMPAAKLMK